MKITKLSIAASLAVACVQVASANSLAQAFENGKVSGEIKSQYFQKEVSDEKVSIWTNGGNLSYETGDFNGLKAGVTLQVASVTADDLDAAPTAYNSDQHVSGAVLSQAYLDYAVNNTSVKIGRQYITSPLIAGSGSRIFKESYEGITVTNTDLPNTTVKAIYVDKVQWRTDIAAGGNDIKDVSDFENAGDGAYSLHLTNNSIENLTIESQYLHHKDYDNNLVDNKIFYLSGSYNINDNYTVAAQTYQSDDGTATNSDGSAYGLNFTANFDKLRMGAAYSTVDDEASINIWDLGNGSDYLYTWSWIRGGVYIADTDAYKLSAGYDITNNLSLDAIYASWKTGNADRASETDLIANYQFNENLSTTFVLATYDKLSTESYKSRLYVSYSF